MGWKPLRLNKTQDSHKSGGNKRAFISNEKGNVFFALFASIGLVGLLGAGVMSTMRGPLTTVVEVNRRVTAESQMRNAAAMIISESVDETTYALVSDDDGDCDGDGKIEPLEFKVGSGPTGGGLIPDSIGSDKQDPWGTDYGYCVWDPGTVASEGDSGEACDNDTAAAHRLTGTNNTGDYVIALVSAGPDKTFQTTCANSSALSKGGDDVVVEYSYLSASAASEGLWKLDPADSGVATISKDLEVTGGATFTGALDLSTSATSALKLGAASMILPTESDLATCNGANDRLLRINTATDPDTLELCDGANSVWETTSAGSSIWQEGAGEDIYYNSGTPQVGIGLTAPDDTLDVVGTVQITSTLTMGDDINMADNKSVVWTTDGEITSDGSGITINTAGADIDVGATVAITGDTTLTGSTSDSSAYVLTANSSAPSVLFSVRNDGLITTNGDMDFNGDIDLSGDMTIGGDINMTDTKGVLWATGGILSDGSGVTVNAGSAAIDIDTGINITGNTDITGTLDVSGATTLDTTLTVAGTTTLNGDVAATDGQIEIVDDVDVAGTVDATDYQYNNVDFTPAACASGSFNRWTATGWTCETDTAGGGGSGGVQTIEETLAAGDDADGENLEGANKIGAAEFCNADLTLCFTPGSVATGDTGIFEIDTSVIRVRSSVPDFGNYDFVVGSSSLDATANNTEDVRMFFDKSKGAFRAGVGGDILFAVDLANTRWNTANVGDYSTAMGYYPMASGAYSTAIGFDAVASAQVSMALGQYVVTSGRNSITMGSQAQVGSGTPNVAIGAGHGNYSAAIGLQSSTQTPYPKVTGDRSFAIFMDQNSAGKNSGFDLTGSDLFAVIGGYALINPSSAAVDVSTGTGGKLALDVEGPIGAANYCDENGNNCFTASDAATIIGGGSSLWVASAGDDIYYNSGTPGVVIGDTSVSGTLTLDVEGDMGAANYCDETGLNCFTASDAANVIAGGSSVWVSSAGDTIYYNSGTDPRVGIGTNGAAVALDVDGSIRFGNGGETCGPTFNGALRYTTGSGVEYCNGSAWTALIARSAVATLVLSPSVAQNMDITVAGTPGVSNWIDFTLTNAGTVTSQTLGLALSNPSNFEIDSGTNTCTGTLASAASCTFKVRAKSFGNGSYNGTVTVTADNNPFALLSGTATGACGTIGSSTGGGLLASCESTYKLIAMPSGCADDTTDPACAGTDTVSKTWSPDYLNVPGANSNADGQTNTNAAIVASNSSGYSVPAARFCDDMTYGGHSDWYLPALNEMTTLYNVKATLGGFDTVSYWTSVQVDASNGRSFDMSAGTNTYSAKVGSRKIRCVRRAPNNVSAAYLSVSPGSANDINYTDTVLDPSNVTQKVFTITNDGGSTSTAITTGLTNTTAFSIISDNCDGNTLAAGASCTLTVKPKVQSYDQSYTGQLTVSADNGINVPISGTGTGFCGRIGTADSGGLLASCQNGYRLIAMPGGCADDTSDPDCSGTGDTVAKTWASSNVVTSASSNTDGPNNTTTIVNHGTANAYSTPSATFCSSLVIGAYSDWYLPAFDEVVTLYTNRNAIGEFAANEYATSTESNYQYQYIRDFSTGSYNNRSKGTAVRFRCTRRETGAAPSTVVLEITPASQIGMDVTGPGNPANGTGVVFTVENTGTGTSGTLTTNIVNTTNFEMTVDNCNGNTLAASATCTITVRPRAYANGNFNGSLVVTDAANSADDTTGISGTATGFPFQSGLWQEGTGDDIYYNSGTPGAVVGDTTVSGTLTFDVEGDLGATNYCDQNGANCFTAATVAASSSIFEIDTNVIRVKSSSGSYANDDFVVGSATLDYGAQASRLYFDKSKGAFRAGYANSTSWDASGANVGNYSAAFGRNTIASGQGSMAFGYNASGNVTASADGSTAFGYTASAGITASGIGATAFGRAGLAAITASGTGATAFGYANSDGGNTVASGVGAIAMGRGVTAGNGTAGSGSGDYAMAIGLQSADRTVSPAITGDRTLGVFMDKNTYNNNDSYTLTGSDLFAVIGGYALINPSSAAADVSTGTGGKLALDVEGNVGASQFCDESGNSCFTAASVSPGLWQKGTGDAIYYNSGTPLVGIGTTAPTNALTFPQSSTGIAFYNTADQTTNYERATIGYSGSAFVIRSAPGGTGADRPLVLSATPITGGSGDAYIKLASNGSASTQGNDIAMHARASIYFRTVGADRMQLTSTGDLLFKTTNGTILAQERRTSGTGAGYSLSVSGGGTNSGTTDQNGGDLILGSGLATGNGSSSIIFKTVQKGQGTGTTDRSSAISMTLESNALTIPGTATTSRPGEAGMQAAANGMIRYNTTSNKFEAYENSAWTNMITAATSSLWTAGTGDKIYYNSGTPQVGIGTTNPTSPLHVVSSVSAAGIGVNETFTTTSTSGNSIAHQITVADSKSGGTSYGLYVDATTPATGSNKYGIYSIAEANSGPVYGVYAQAKASSTGTTYALYGVGSYGTKSYGVYGTTGSTTGVGVYGESAAHTGTTGVEAVAKHTGANALAVNSTVLTTGKLGNFTHTTSAFSGDMLFGNMAAGSGTFTGNFARFQNNSVTKFIVDSAGKAGAVQYCDESLANCFTAASVGSPLWQAGTGDKIYYNSGTPQVGIGLTNPGTSLDVYGTIRATGGSTPPWPTSGKGFEISWDADSSYSSHTGGSGGAAFQSYDRDASAWRDLRFKGHNIGFHADDALTMTITSTGYVGIGDDTPNSGTGGQLKLDVEGPVGATKYCDASGNNCFTAADAAASISGGGGLWVASAGGTIYYNSGTPKVAIGSTGTSGSLMLDVEGTIGATQYCDASGNNCFTSTNVITSVAGAAAPTYDNDLDDLDDVNTAGVVNGQCIVYNSVSSTWEVGACGDGIEIVSGAATPTFLNDLNDLDDVNAPTPSTNDVLTWSGTEWIAQAGGGGLWTAGAGTIYYNSGTPLVGIGTSSPNEGALEVKGGTVCVDTNSDNTASSCIANESDVRLKKNIRDLDYSLDTLMKLRPVTFDWRYDDPEVLKHYSLVSRFKSQPHSIGFIAQEVQKIVPEAIESETIGDAEVQYLQLDYQKLTPVIVKALQEIKTDQDNLSGKVESALKSAELMQTDFKELKAENAALKSELDDLSEQVAVLNKAAIGSTNKAGYNLETLLAAIALMMALGVGIGLTLRRRHE